MKVLNLSCVTSTLFAKLQITKHWDRKTNCKDHYHPKPRLKTEQYTHLSTETQKMVFKAPYCASKMELSSIFSLRIDWYTKEFFSLILLNCGILDLCLDGNNLYSRFRTWFGSDTMQLASLSMLSWYADSYIFSKGWPTIFEQILIWWSSGQTFVPCRITVVKNAHNHWSKKQNKNLFTCLKRPETAEKIDPLFCLFAEKFNMIFLW